VAQLLPLQARLPREAPLEHPQLEALLGLLLVLPVEARESEPGLGLGLGLAPVLALGSVPVVVPPQVPQLVHPPERETCISAKRIYSPRCALRMYDVSSKM